MAYLEIERYQRWLTGDAHEGAILVNEHHEDLVRWIARRVDSVHTAHDIAQDVWIQAMQGTYTGRGAFRSWLRCVARTYVVRHYRHRSRTPSLTPQTWTSPTRNVLRGEVAAALDELSNPDQLAACRMCFLDDASVAQIAVSTRAKEKTVRSRIRLASLKLRSRLEPSPWGSAHGR